MSSRLSVARDSSPIRRVEEVEVALEVEATFDMVDAGAKADPLCAEKAQRPNSCRDRNFIAVLF